MGPVQVWPIWALTVPEPRVGTYRWARPAFLTAEEMALMAVSMAVMSWVSSPVAPLAWRPVSMMNRVRVQTSVSNADWSDMLGSGSPSRGAAGPWMGSSDPDPEGLFVIWY